MCIRTQIEKYLKLIQKTNSKISGNFYGMYEKKYYSYLKTIETQLAELAIENFIYPKGTFKEQRDYSDIGVNMLMAGARGFIEIARKKIFSDAKYILMR